MVNRSKTVKFCALTAGLAAVAGGALDAANTKVGTRLYVADVEVRVVGTNGYGWGGIKGFHRWTGAAVLIVDEAGYRCDVVGVGGTAREGEDRVADDVGVGFDGEDPAEARRGLGSARDTEHPGVFAPGGGVAPTGTTSEQLHEMMRREHDQWKKVVTRAGIRIQ